MSVAWIDIVISGAPAIITAVAAALYSKRQSTMARDKLKVDLELKQKRLETEFRDSRTDTKLAEVSVLEFAAQSSQYLEHLRQELLQIQEFMADSYNQQKLIDGEVQKRIVALGAQLDKLVQSTEQKN